MRRIVAPIWLKRTVVILYTYIFITSVVMYFVGHRPILPDHVNKDYPVLDGVPPVSQESIIRAVNNFEIQVPMLSFYPSLDIDMDKTHLGEAYSIPLLHMCVPTIGAGAFTSWGRLGSTLAHEVEVHCNQNWWRSSVEKLFLYDPNPMMEREAYTYTLLDSKRFHLTFLEQLNITYVMQLLYPIGDKNEQRQSTP